MRGGAVTGKPIEQPGAGIMIDLFEGRLAGMILVPMAMVGAALTLKVIVAVVDMMERSVGEGEQKACDHAEMKAVPHSSSVYTYAREVG